MHMLEILSHYAQWKIMPAYIVSASLPISSWLCLGWPLPSRIWELTSHPPSVCLSISHLLCYTKKALISWAFAQSDNITAKWDCLITDDKTRVHMLTVKDTAI